MTPTHLRPQAEVDLVERTRYYRREGGDELGSQFFDAAMRALESIGHMPGAATPRIGELCDIPGLRHRRVAGFPCDWFYFIATDHIDVVRLLAETRDLPAILADTARE